jgi:hypothetical protein
MTRETDTLEDYIFEGNVAIIPSSNPDNGNGNLEIYATLYTDNILANTINASVNLENTLFLNGVITLPKQSLPPSQPILNNYSFFIDPSSHQLKSINSFGITTTYQPITTKGDLQAYSNTQLTQIRLPVGKDNAVLIADSTSDTGLTWSSTIIGSSSQALNVVYLYSTVPQTIVEYPVGSFFCTMYTDNNSGAATGNIISCKSLANIIGNTTVLSSTPSNVSGGVLNGIWDVFSGLQVYKTYTEYPGNYHAIQSSILITTSNVTLTGTATSMINMSMYGAFFISVTYNTPVNTTGVIGGPTAVFMCTKSTASSVAGQITRINSSPATGCNLILSWPANSGLLINKTTTNSVYDGVYNIVDNFQGVRYQTSITLSGTDPSTIPINVFPYYSSKSFFIQIKGTIIGAPNGIFSFSKNMYSLNGTYTAFRSAGTTSGELLQVQWLSGQLFQINKTDVNYNGVYSVNFTNLI